MTEQQADRLIEAVEDLTAELRRHRASPQPCTGSCTVLVARVSAADLASALAYRPVALPHSLVRRRDSTDHAGASKGALRCVCEGS